MMQNKKPRVLAVIGALLVVFAAIFFLFLSTQLTLVACPDEWSEISNGMSVENVIDLLGNPSIECDAESDLSNCYAEGYAKPSVTLGWRRMVYLGCDKAFYVFFDEKGIVVGTWWGNS